MRKSDVALVKSSTIVKINGNQISIWNKLKGALVLIELHIIESLCCLAAGHTVHIIAFSSALHQFDFSKGAHPNLG